MAENDVNPQYSSNLQLFCRCCAKKMSKEESQKAMLKDKLKLRPTLRDYLFGTDRPDVEPKYVCQTCVRRDMRSQF